MNDRACGPGHTTYRISGRPMKDYVFVLPEGTADDDALRRWVDLAAAFVARLPPKNV